MRLKHISKVKSCPHCKSTFGYFQKAFVRGWVNDITLYDVDKHGEREKYNYNMFDDIEYSAKKKTCYCFDCKKPIGTQDPYNRD